MLSIVTFSIDIARKNVRLCKENLSPWNICTKFYTFIQILKFLNHNIIVITVPSYYNNNASVVPSSSKRCAYLGWVNADVDRGAVSLLTLDALDVDDKLLTIHLHDLAHLLTFVVTSHDLQQKQHTILIDISTLFSMSRHGWTCAALVRRYRLPCSADAARPYTNLLFNIMEVKLLRLSQLLKLWTR